LSRDGGAPFPTDDSSSSLFLSFSRTHASAMQRWSFCAKPSLPPSLPPSPPSAPRVDFLSTWRTRQFLFERGALGPLRTLTAGTIPRPSTACTCVCTYVRARGYSFAAPLPRPSVRPYFRSYVHMFVCWVLESRGRPTAVKPKKTGRGRDPPRPRSFRREISPALSPSTPSFSHGGLKR